MTDSLISPACCEGPHRPREWQHINRLLTLINSEEEEKALTKYYSLIVFLSWAQETCLLLQRMRFTRFPKPIVIISLTLGGTAPWHGMGPSCQESLMRLSQVFRWGDVCFMRRMRHRDFWLPAAGLLESRLLRAEKLMGCG